MSVSKTPAIVDPSRMIPVVNQRSVEAPLLPKAPVVDLEEAPIVGLAEHRAKLEQAATRVAARTFSRDIDESMTAKETARRVDAHDQRRIEEGVEITEAGKALIAKAAEQEKLAQSDKTPAEDREVLFAGRATNLAQSEALAAELHTVLPAGIAGVFDADKSVKKNRDIQGPLAKIEPCYSEKVRRTVNELGRFPVVNFVVAAARLTYGVVKTALNAIAALFYLIVCDTKDSVKHVKQAGNGLYHMGRAVVEAVPFAGYAFKKRDIASNEAYDQKMIDSAYKNAQDTRTAVEKKAHDDARIAFDAKRKELVELRKDTATHPLNDPEIRPALRHYRGQMHMIPRTAQQVRFKGTLKELQHMHKERPLAARVRQTQQWTKKEQTQLEKLMQAKREGAPLPEPKRAPYLTPNGTYLYRQGRKFVEISATEHAKLRHHGERPAVSGQAMELARAPRIASDRREMSIRTIEQDRAGTLRLDPWRQARLAEATSSTPAQTVRAKFDARVDFADARSEFVAAHVAKEVVSSAIGKALAAVSEEAPAQAKMETKRS